MQSTKPNSAAASDQAQWFATTHWSVVLAAGQEATPQAGDALEHLCRDYWYPLFAYLRRQGHDAPDAQDLTQSFFLHLLAGNRLRTVTPARGKFRSFLIAALKNFVANEWDKRQTLKRGGHVSFLPLDAELGEARYRREPALAATPDKALNKAGRWRCWKKSCTNCAPNMATKRSAVCLKRCKFISRATKAASRTRRWPRG